MKFLLDPTKQIKIILSERRTKRPKVFNKEACPFCKGNELMTTKETGKLPGEDWIVRSFRNAFPIISEPHGEHDVIVDNCVHGKLFQDLSEKELSLLFSMYRHRFKHLLENPRAQYVLLFKNHGREAGASIEHEHSQILSLPFVPEMIEREASACEGNCFFCRMLEDEENNLLFETKDFKIISPSFARFPYELWVLSKKHERNLIEFSESKGTQLLQAIAECIKRFYGITQAYNLAFHNAPKERNYHFHVEIYPHKVIPGGLELGTGLNVNVKKASEAIKELKERK